MTLAERLQVVRERIESAAVRAGRDPASILLLAVTKIFPAPVIQEAYDLGLRDFGENYVQEFEDKAPAVRACSNLRLLGLMTMPPWSDDPEAARPYFRRLRELGERHGFTQLSMGMSHDIETAIEEGSTCVRVGTALFGKRQKA